MRGTLQAVTDRQFDQVIETSAVPVLVEFWKPGCGHCQALMKELAQLQQELDERVLILAMNVDEEFQIPAELEISSLPALAYYQNGQFVKFIGGLGKKAELLKQLECELGR